MRISIHTLGTRGDVQPYVALALGLMHAGHRVSLAAPAQFEDFVARHAVPFAAMPREFLDLMDDPEAKAVMARSRGGFGAGFKLVKKIGPMMRRLFDRQWEAARDFGPDLLVFHPKGLAVPHIADRLGVPAVLASPLPGFTPTSAFASPIISRPVPRFLNRVSHGFMAGSSTVLFSGTMGRWRQEVLGLPRRTRLPPWRELPTLYAYSPAVVPVPPEWGPHVCVSGYWFLDGQPDWSPPPSLASFLRAGPPPVYIGFGSMPTIDPVAATAELVEAVKMSGQRAVLASGWGGLGGGELPASIHVIDDAPHDRLFPLVSAVVHHGGAGTTAAGLRAGKPTVICPFFGDQPFWGRRVEQLGAGPAPIARADLSPARLAAAIREAVESPAMRNAAEALGHEIRGENGVATAVEFIEQVSRRAAAA